MDDLKRKVDRHRRQLDDLVIELGVKRQLALDEFDFKTAGQLENAMLGAQKCNNELFYVSLALG